MPAYPQHKIKTIEYKSAPSGYINIEKWEPPFMEVKEGYGYIGIIAEDSIDGTLQCHICGIWSENLSAHITGGHKHKNCFEYRNKFGLLQSTALQSKRIRLAHSKSISKLQKAGKMGLGNNLGTSPMIKGNKFASNRKGIKKAPESANKYGKCDLQVMTKIIELSKELGKTPSLVEIKERYGGGIVSIMHSRYGSYVKYCRNYLGLEPLRSNNNAWTEQQWKDYLLDVGRKTLKKYGKITTTNLAVKDSRYIYKYYKNIDNFRKVLAKE